MERILISFRRSRLALVFVAAAAASLAQTPPALTDVQLIRAWLTSDCGLDDTNNLAQQLISRARVVEAPLVDALRNGPPADEVNAVERLANERFDKHQSSLKDANRRIEMKEEDRAAFSGLTREAFVGHERNSFVLGWKEQAVAGLGLVGGVQARKALDAVVRDRNSPLRDQATAALNRLTAR